MTAVQFADAGPIDSTDPIADQIAGLGSREARVVIGTAADELLKTVRGNDDLSDPQLLRRIEDILAKRSDEVAKIIGDALVTADVTGAAEIAGANVIPVTLGGSGSAAPPFNRNRIGTGDLFPEGVRVKFPTIDDAVETINKADVFAGSDFRATADRARRKAFSITTDLSRETVADIRGVLSENLARGPSARDFKRDVKALFDEGTGLSDARINMVFRNNMGAVFGDAMDRSLENPIVVDAFPYRRYFATRDTRVRVEHLALEKLGLDGTDIYSKDDPVWRQFRPPWDYGCRCSFSPATVEQAAAAGVLEAIAWLERARVLAERFGGVAASFVVEAAPRAFEFVDPPEFQASPEFRRTFSIAA